jgi:hypothetical protein
MRPSTPRSSLLRQALAVDCAISTLAAIALWAVVLVQAWPRIMAGGNLCSSDPTFLGHCPACLPALAATLMAAGFALALVVRRPVRPV